MQIKMIATAAVVAIVSTAAAKQHGSVVRPLAKSAQRWSIRGKTPFQIFQAKSTTATAQLTVCVRANSPGTSVEVKNDNLDNFFVLEAARPCSTTIYSFPEDGRAVVRLVKPGPNKSTVDADPSERASGTYSVKVISVASPLPVVSTPIYVGKTPNVDAGEITTNPVHNYHVAPFYGYTIAAGPFAGPALFVGLTANKNASVVNSEGGDWRGGLNGPIGYAIKPGRQSVGDMPLYVGVSPDRCRGAVSDTEHFQDCVMVLFGFAKHSG